MKHIVKGWFGIFVAWTNFFLILFAVTACSDNNSIQLREKTDGTGVKGDEDQLLLDDPLTAALTDIAKAEEELRVLHEKIRAGTQHVQKLAFSLGDRRNPLSCQAHQQVMKELIEAQFDLHDKLGKREVLVQRWNQMARNYTGKFASKAAAAKISDALKRGSFKIVNYFIGTGAAARVGTGITRGLLGAVAVGPIGAYATLGCSTSYGAEPLRSLPIPEGVDPSIYCYERQNEFLALSDQIIERFGTTATCAYPNSDLDRMFLDKNRLEAIVNLCYDNFYLLHPDLVPDDSVGNFADEGYGTCPTDAGNTPTPGGGASDDFEDYDPAVQVGGYEGGVDEDSDGATQNGPVDFESYTDPSSDWVLPED